jgi:hypothetical protein
VRCGGLDAVGGIKSVSSSGREYKRANSSSVREPGYEMRKRMGWIERRMGVGFSHFFPP